MISVHDSNIFKRLVDSEPRFAVVLLHRRFDMASLGGDMQRCCPRRRRGFVNINPSLDQQLNNLRMAPLSRHVQRCCPIDGSGLISVNTSLSKQASKQSWCGIPALQRTRVLPQSQLWLDQYQP